MEALNFGYGPFSAKHPDKIEVIKIVIHRVKAMFQPVSLLKQFNLQMLSTTPQISTYY